MSCFRRALDLFQTCFTHVSVGSDPLLNNLTHVGQDFYLFYMGWARKTGFGHHESDVNQVEDRGGHWSSDLLFNDDGITVRRVLLFCTQEGKTHPRRVYKNKPRLIYASPKS